MAANRSNPYGVLTESESLCEVGELPYVPLPLEKIDEYTKLSDYAENRIKKIHTVGIWKFVNRAKGVLISTRGNESVKIKMDVSDLPNAPFFESSNPNEPRGPGKPLRVFGTLGTRENEFILRVDNFLPVTDVECAERILRLSAQLARQKISLYRVEPTYNDKIRQLIDRMSDPN